MLRLGVLSDLHCELEPAGSRWINAFASDRLDAMTDAALAWFAEAETDVIVVLGDVVQLPEQSDLEHVFDRLVAARVAPVAAVNGNHDLRLGEVFAASAHAHGISLLYAEPFVRDGVACAGVELARGPRPPQYTGRAGVRPGEAVDVIVVASHFPVLSEASRVAGAGIPYAGDLVNRAALETSLRSDPRPTVVLSGHIHARCSVQEGSLLQFTVGALIEPPFDATIVEIDRAGGPRVRRRSRRLGEIAPINPVFAADEECWEWQGGWQPASNGGA